MIGGTSRPKASGKSGIARPALVWRMTAPITSWRKITAAVAEEIRARELRENAARRSAGLASAQRGEVTTAIATVRQKKVWARHACATETEVGSSQSTVSPPRMPCAMTAASAP